MKKNLDLILHWVFEHSELKFVKVMGCTIILGNAEAMYWNMHIGWDI